MDDRLADIRRMLRTLAEETPESIGLHPGDEHIVAYYSGALPADEMDSIEDHLVFCRNCATDLLALAAFCASDDVISSSWAGFVVQFDGRQSRYVHLDQLKKFGRNFFSSGLNTFTNLPSK